MEMRLEQVTPKKAADWLKKNTCNRPLDIQWVHRIAAAIKRGEWEVNGDTIKMNGDVLIDGQHRCHAVVEAGVGVPSYVVRGIERKAFDTIDQNKRRTVGQMFAREKEKHYNALASACRFLFCYEKGTARMFSTHGGFTPKTAWTVLRSHPGIRDAMQFVMDIKATDLISGGAAAALYWLMQKKNEDEAERYWKALGTGENINRTMPVYLVRERLRRNRSEQTKLRTVALAAFCVKGWNATRKNTKLGTLKWLDDEDFPEVQ